MTTTSSTLAITTHADNKLAVRGLAMPDLLSRSTPRPTDFKGPNWHETSGQNQDPGCPSHLPSHTTRQRNGPDTHLGRYNWPTPARRLQGRTRDGMSTRPGSATLVRPPRHRIRRHVFYDA